MVRANQPRNCYAGYNGIMELPGQPDMFIIPLLKRLSSTVTRGNGKSPRSSPVLACRTLPQSPNVDTGMSVDQEEDTGVRSSPPSQALIRLNRRKQRRETRPKRPAPSSDLSTLNTLSILHKGNSDPFSAAGISITPQVNQILIFARDICLPAFYFVDSLRDSSSHTEPSRDIANSSGWISSPAARLGWQQVVDSLNDKCTALACLSTYLALMAACNISPSQTTAASLRLRAGSSALLRHRLLHPKEGSVESRRELLWQVFWHFYAEFFAGNMLAAQIHGAMLRQSCEAAGEGVITPHFLDSIIFVDYHMSAKYMTRTVLDTKKWVPDVFAPIWQEIDPKIPDVTNERGADLDESLATDPLRSVFIRTRQSLILFNQTTPPHPVEIDFESLYYWLNSHSYVDSGTLIDHYLNLVEQSIHHPQPSHSLGHAYTQASLAAAALYSLRDVGNAVKINDVDVVDASSTIIHRLRVALDHALASCSSAELQSFRAAHLWCAFIGALAEQRALRDQHEKSRVTQLSSATNSEVTSTSTVRLGSSTWFTTRLAAQAHLMNLFSWGQVSDILKNFIYSDALEPHGSRWFWEAMGVYLDSRKKEEAAAAVGVTPAESGSSSEATMAEVQQLQHQHQLQHEQEQRSRSLSKSGLSTTSTSSTTPTPNPELRNPTSGF